MIQPPRSSSEVWRELLKALGHLAIMVYALAGLFLTTVCMTIFCIKSHYWAMTSLFGSYTAAMGYSIYQSWPKKTFVSDDVP